MPEDMGRDAPPLPREGFPDADPASLVEIQGMHFPRYFLEECLDLEQGNGKGLISISTSFRKTALESLEKRIESGEDPEALDAAIEYLKNVPNEPCGIFRTGRDKWELKLGGQKLMMDRESITLALAGNLPTPPARTEPSKN